MDLTAILAFVNARLDELERDGPGHCVGCTSGPEFAGTMYACDVDSVRAYLRADVAAKRRIVDRAEKSIRSVGPHLGDMWVLRELAAPFAQHPDFDPAWAVGGEQS